MSRPLGTRRQKLTRAQEKRAYAAATERDSVNGYEQCQRCGRFGPCDRDHRQNRTSWNTTVGNLQLLGGAFGCGCHQWKTENPAEAIESGFTVPSWGDPLEWPAWRVNVGWALYFDAPVDGKWWRCITESEARERMEGIS